MIIISFSAKTTVKPPCYSDLILLWHPPSIRQLIVCQGQLGHVQKIEMQIFSSILKRNIIFPATGYVLWQYFINGFFFSVWKMVSIRGFFLHIAPCSQSQWLCFQRNLNNCFLEQLQKKYSLLCAWYLSPWLLQGQPCNWLYLTVHMTCLWGQ